ncbi:MAG: DUF2085 domain-containing protein [Thermoflexales bacterium]|nr:DUF2085 domain-containing protein [Thermoflexales bacterium]
MTQADDNHVAPSRAVTWPGLLILLLSLALFGLWLWGIPGDLLQKLNLVGYAICHRIPERSFVIDGQQMPLCARCTGIYLGVASNLLVMTRLRRWRSAELPRPALLAVLFTFFLVMGLDGINSYMTFFPGAPHLYEPHNGLRLATGLLHGITLSTLIFPIFNQTMWASVEWRPALRNFRELGLVLLIGLAGAGLVMLQIPALLYPLAILSSGGVLVMLGMINITMVVTVLRHENRFRTWRQALAPLAVGLVLALVEVSGLDVFRAYLTQVLDLPF